VAKPAHYTSKVAIPLPFDEVVRRIIGKSYNPGERSTSSRCLRKPKICSRRRLVS
jgi:hypothetical protein